MTIQLSEQEWFFFSWSKPKLSRCMFRLIIIMHCDNYMSCEQCGFGPLASCAKCFEDY